MQLWVIEHSPKSMKEVITVSFKVAHSYSNAFGGRSQVGEKSSVKPVNKGSFQ